MILNIVVGGGSGCPFPTLSNPGLYHWKPILSSRAFPARYSNSHLRVLELESKFDFRERGNDPTALGPFGRDNRGASICRGVRVGRFLRWLRSSHSGRPMPDEPPRFSSPSSRAAS